MKLKYIIYLIWLIGLPISAQAQQTAEQDSSNILVKNADNFIRDATKLPAVQYLRGNVRMFQDSIFMFCDSAILINNDLTALDNVIIIHQDTIKVFSDSLIYDGDARIANLYDNVVLENGEQKLFTNILNYNLTEEIASYVDTAIMVNDEAQISSIRGVYKVKEYEAKFMDEVVIIDSTFRMECDSLLYNTELDLATFLSFTKIDKDDKHIECERGYYNLQKDEALFAGNAIFRDSTSVSRAEEIRYFGKRSEFVLIGNATYKTDKEFAKGQLIKFNEETNEITLEGDAYYTSDEQTVRGDKIVYNRDTEDIEVIGKGNISSESLNIQALELSYDKATQQGLAKGDVLWIDTTDNYRIKGEFLSYNDSIDYMKTIRVDSIRPLLSHFMENDTMHISADSLEFFSETIEGDTLKSFNAIRDSRIIFGDISAICRELNYSDSDSTFTLIGDPIMWNDSTQFFADTIFIHLKNDEISRMRMQGNGMMINEIATDYYNQISGRSFIAYFDSTSIKTMDVKGNARAYYFMQDEEDAFIGLNATDCSYMRFFFKSDELEHIKFYEEPSSILTPMQKLNQSNLYLNGFSWNPEWRPKTIEDLLVINNFANRTKREKSDDQSEPKIKAPEIKSADQGPARN